MVQVSAKIMKPSTEAESQAGRGTSRCDTGPSLGDTCQARGVGLKQGQVLLEMGMGRGLGVGAVGYLGLGAFQSSGPLTARWSGLSRCCDSP